MFHHTFAAMNTRFSMVLPGLGAQDGMALGRAAQALLRRQETMMSRFDPHGELAWLNRNAAHAPAPLSAPLWDVLQACQGHHRMTAGAFDIAQGGGPGQRGMHLLEADGAARTLRFGAPGVQLDLGGIGKGIALDLVRRYLVDHGVEQAFLSFGESSIAVLGSHPAADHWPVAVEHLFEPGTPLYRFDLRDGAMSTSGNRDGQAHIIDPLDGRAVGGYRTVSVACASAADAEALSTALFILAPRLSARRRAQVLDNYPGTRAVGFDYALRDGAWTAERTWVYDQQAS
jgi:thiamine biosynthesis lipoprotein